MYAHPFAMEGNAAMIACYVQDIRRCLKSKCWFAALSLALALPDICGMAEFPNGTVTERYITWYDRHVGQGLCSDGMADRTPYLSGEVVYNLRNTFLHQGSPTINSDKVKAPRNQVDRFILMLGDGTKIHTIAMAVEALDAAVRTLLVDVSFLCRALCDAAESYSRDHREDFHFEYNVLPQSALFGEKSPLDFFVGRGDPIGDLLEEKLKTGDRDIHIQSNVTEMIVNGLKKPQARVSKEKKQPVEAAASEHKLRCYFGQHFKEKKYTQKKEDIIAAVQASHTKTQLNDKLTRLFPGADVKVILSRLKPLTRDWPGR